MQDETQAVATPVVPVEKAEPQTAPTKKKVFTRNDIRNSIDVAVQLPRLYPDYDPWGFKFRIKLSAATEEKRQDFLSLAPVIQAEKAQEQNLTEVCDLLLELPTGFGDLKDNGSGPGPSFREYVETCTSPQMKEMLYTIAEGAVNLYWRTIMPVEFRKSV